MKIIIKLTKKRLLDDRRWNDRNFGISDLFALLRLAREQEYHLKKYRDAYVIFANNKRVATLDVFGNVSVDDALYSAYKQKYKTQRDLFSQLKAEYNDENAVEAHWVPEIVNEFFTRRGAEEHSRRTREARNRALAGSAEMFRKQIGDKPIRAANGEMYTAEDFAAYLQNIYGNYHIFDKWWKKITEWYINKTLREDNVAFIQDFIRSLELLAQAHYDEYDENFNGLSPREIVDLFKVEAKEISLRERKAAQKVERRETDYEIIPIRSQEEARKWRKYTSWCVTSGSYDSYVEPGNMNKADLFYFMAKKGFENVPRKRGPGAPKDEYGLSLIAVSVKPDGSLNTATTRWNHDCGGNDRALTVAEISELAGGDFYSIFKPLSTKEDIDKGIISQATIIKKGRSGKNRLIEYRDKTHIASGNEIVRDRYEDIYNLFIIKENKNGYILAAHGEEWVILDPDFEVLICGNRIDAQNYARKHNISFKE